MRKTNHHLANGERTIFSSYEEALKVARAVKARFEKLNFYNPSACSTEIWIAPIRDSKGEPVPDRWTARLAYARKPNWTAVQL